MKQQSAIQAHLKGSSEMQERQYQSGFGNHFASEAEAGTLPVGRNSPQKPAHGLYAEQLSGTAFTAPRSENLRSWLYKIRPSVMHGAFKKIDRGLLRSRPFDELDAPPDQLRWNALAVPKKPTDFIDGLVTIAGNGDSASVRGCAVHLYVANKSMEKKFFYNSDGELLILPELGQLKVRTEFGTIAVSPCEIIVIPKGVKFQIELLNDTARGYICENYGLPLRLPNLGPIGANGLANPRDFLAPTAAYENVEGDFELIAKFQGHLYRAKLDHSPLDVVGWHGNYFPYKYDLTKFNVINTVSFDHPDPSIYTVLTSPSEIEGVANIDFVIFPSRWMVAEDTFRPPYYHRNVMSEYMGLITGVYDAKEDGFIPGCGSLHNSHSAHGPDAATFEKASSCELKPTYQGGTLAFMFESSLVFKPTKFALEDEIRQPDYQGCWAGLQSHFHLE